MIHEGLFCCDGGIMRERGFYIIKDEFFVRMNEPFLKGNKNECRPHYYCFEDDGVIWMIPLSSQIEKYELIINKRKQRDMSCDILHILTLDDNRKSVFLIQDIFPITEEYIEREYLLHGNHLMLTSEKSARLIEKKARKVIRLLKHGVKFTETQPDILKILEKLHT